MSVADAAPALEMLAWQHAARGSHDDAAAALDRSAALVERAGTATVAAHLALARAFCALCRDDLDEFVGLLEDRIAIDGGRGAMGELLGVAPLLVEAYTALDRSAEAAALATRYAAVAETTPRTQALVERCRALAEPDEDGAIAAFDAALAAETGLVLFISGTSNRSRGGQGWLRLRMRRTPKRSAAAFPPA